MKIKEQNGSVTLYVLISMLIFTTALVSLFISSANKQQTQIEAIEQLKQVYGAYKTSEEIQQEAHQAYLKYIGGAIIPIYNWDQFKKIGTEEKVYINGKIYVFTLDEKTYMLKNDIIVENYTQEDESNFERIQAYLSSGNLDLEGQGYTITLINDQEEEIYSQKNNFQEPINENE